MILTLMLTLSAAPAHAAGPAGWDHPGFDAEDSYYNPGESVVNLSTVNSLTRRWSVRLRSHDEACGSFSAPIVAAGKAIATDQLGISAYNFQTGAAIWHYNWPDPGDAHTPLLAVSDGTLIAASGDCNSMSDPDGSLTALDLATGRVRWSLDTGFPIESFAVDKGFAAVSGASESDEQATVAYRATDGKVAWRKPNFHSSGVSANGRLLLTDTKLTTAVNIANGAALWTKKAWWQGQAATPASDRFLVTNNAKALSAINAATGAVLWTAPGADNKLVSTDGRRIYRGGFLSIEALDVVTGRHLWSRKLGDQPSQPLRAGGLLYTGGPILAPTSGAILRQLPPAPGIQLVVAGHLLSIDNGTLTSYAP